MTKVKVTFNYRDLELNRFVVAGEELEVSDERATLLVSKRLVKVLEISDDIKIEEKEEKPKVKTKELKVSKKTK
jgi:hypothetical protein